MGQWWGTERHRGALRRYWGSNGGYWEGHTGGGGEEGSDEAPPITARVPAPPTRVPTPAHGPPRPAPTWAHTRLPPPHAIM